MLKPKILPMGLLFEVEFDPATLIVGLICVDSPFTSGTGVEVGSGVGVSVGKGVGVSVSKGVDVLVGN